MPEWSIGAVSKTVERYALQGFESLSLRVGGKPGRDSRPGFTFIGETESLLSRRLYKSKAKVQALPDRLPTNASAPAASGEG